MEFGKFIAWLKYLGVEHSSLEEMIDSHLDYKSMFHPGNFDKTCKMFHIHDDNLKNKIRQKEDLHFFTRFFDSESFSLDEMIRFVNPDLEYDNPQYHVQLMIAKKMSENVLRELKRKAEYIIKNWEEQEQIHSWDVQLQVEKIWLKETINRKNMEKTDDENKNRKRLFWLLITSQPLEWEIIKDSIDKLVQKKNDEQKQMTTEQRKNIPCNRFATCVHCGRPIKN